VIRFTGGVRFSQNTPEVARAINVAADVYASVGAHTLTVTSGNDSRHMKGSKHYLDHAVDLRTGHHWKVPWLTPAQAQGVVGKMQALLGDDFDVVLESDHIHVEFDPTVCTP
jgi:hypothetical protein